MTYKITKDTKISIQGYKGSFHYNVAKNVSSKSKIIFNDNFSDVFNDISNGSAEFGVVAFENPTDGTVIKNLNSILENNLYIVGEYFLDTSHSLLALPNQKISDIKEIHSQQMALRQCSDFIEEFKGKIVITEDTAKASKNISDKKLKNIAAIAPSTAAKIYNLEVLQTNLESIKPHITRFILISKNKYKGTIKNKTTIIIDIKHQVGSLSSILNSFSKLNINLTKLESMPIPNKPWNFRFIIDYKLNSDSKKGKEILEKIKKHTNNICFLGSYPTLSKNTFV